jgi:hypothetical protein
MRIARGGDELDSNNGNDGEVVGINSVFVDMNM